MHACRTLRFTTSLQIPTPSYLHTYPLLMLRNNMHSQPIQVALTNKTCRCADAAGNSRAPQRRIARTTQMLPSNTHSCATCTGRMCGFQHRGHAWVASIAVQILHV